MGTATLLRAGRLAGMLVVWLAAPVVPSARCGGETNHVFQGISAIPSEVVVAAHESLLPLRAQHTPNSLEELYPKAFGTLTKQIQRHLPNKTFASPLEELRNGRNCSVHYILRPYS
jgi:hypothetical protein